MTTGETLYFEGAEDLLRFPEYWVGSYRQRSDIRIVLGEGFHRGIIPRELVDSRFYHLDTCFCPLRPWLAPRVSAALHGGGSTLTTRGLDERVLHSDILRSARVLIDFPLF